MTFSRNTLAMAYWGVTVLLLVVSAAVAAWFTPVEATMGPIQKILYLHLPAAINMFFGCGLVFVASIGYYWQRKGWWDHLASAAAEIAVLWAAVVLVTGVVWAHDAWGVWWTWSPRLTFSLVLFALYVGYVLLRGSVESPQRRALICAGYGIVAFLDVPLVYLSVKLIPEIHPADVALDPTMRRALALCLVAITLLCAGMVAVRFRSAARTAGRDSVVRARGQEALR